MVTLRSPRGKTAWAANIGRKKWGVNERKVHNVVSQFGFPDRRGTRMRHGYLSPSMRSGAFLLLTVVFVAACRPVVAPVPVAAPPDAVGRVPLPPMPLVEGPLAPKVVYPQVNQMIGSRDSTFILGSVGNGRATLTVNGLPVRVWPNGSYLAFVPNPPPTAPQYDLVAVLGSDTARVTQPVRVAGMPVDSTRPLAPPPPPNVVTDTTPDRKSVV